MIRKNFILLLKRYSYIIMHSFASLVNLQKQLTRGVLRKRCSENMQLIYRRTPMPKCDFNKVAKKLY